MRKISWAFIILAGSFISGCGGGGSGVAVPTPPTSRPIATNTLRTFANGDQIQYTLTGNIMTGGVNNTISGTATYSIATNASPPDPTGITRSINTLTINETWSNGTIINTADSLYYSQDAAGNFNVYGDSPPDNWITTAPGFATMVKSPIVSGSSWTNTYTQQNGDQTTETITVIGQATAFTGMGIFEAYKIQTKSTVVFAVLGRTDVVTEIDYVVPSIGPVKTTIDLQSTDNTTGAVITGQLILSASTTNIPF